MVPLPCRAYFELRSPQGRAKASTYRAGHGTTRMSQSRKAEQQIPAGVGTPELAPVTTGLGEIYQYVIHPKKGSEQKYSAMDLRTMQDWIVGRQLSGIKGVAEVTAFGGIAKQYEVAINPDRLKAMNVTIPEIFTALEKNKARKERHLALPKGHFGTYSNKCRSASAGRCYFNQCRKYFTCAKSSKHTDTSRYFERNMFYKMLMKKKL